MSYEDYQQWLQYVAAKKQPAITVAEQAELQQIGELLEEGLADVAWEEIEAGREDRWF